jgi:hypothetical protein
MAKHKGSKTSLKAVPGDKETDMRTPTSWNNGAEPALLYPCQLVIIDALAAVIVLAFVASRSQIAKHAAKPSRVTQRLLRRHAQKPSRGMQRLNSILVFITPAAKPWKRTTPNQ